MILKKHEKHSQHLLLAQVCGPRCVSQLTEQRASVCDNFQKSVLFYHLQQSWREKESTWTTSFAITFTNAYLYDQMILV